MNNNAIISLGGGSGRIIVSSHGSRAIFSDLSATYPLKLLTPRVFENAVALVYILTYGGGLVSGDQIDLQVKVTDSATLVLLSQGSTKVFKSRPGRHLATFNGNNLAPGAPTSQIMTFMVLPSSSLFILPDPVTCFRSASYNQIQTFHLAANSSAAILDWLTSGRRSLGEDWVFSRYYSVNEIFIDGKRIAKDVMLLQDNDIAISSIGASRSLAARLAPYSCYAMLFLLGPHLQLTIHRLLEEYEKISVMKTRAPDDLIWSLSPIVGHGLTASAVVVRIAGKETEAVKRWLKNALLPVKDVVGSEVFKQAFI